MRVVAINEAEAIIEPFWDGGSSEHPTDKLSLLGQYDISIDPAARAKVWQTWCSVEVLIERAPVDSPVVVMERACDLDVTGYDVFRVFASVPRWVRMTVKAEIDGVMCTLIDAPGVDANDEFDGAFAGARITRLRLEFTLTEPRLAATNLVWLGLANRAAQDRMEAKTSPYTPDWPGSTEFRAGVPVAEHRHLFRRGRAGGAAGEDRRGAVSVHVRSAARGGNETPRRDAGDGHRRPDRQTGTAAGAATAT